MFKLPVTTLFPSSVNSSNSFYKRVQITAEFSINQDSFPRLATVCVTASRIKCIQLLQGHPVTRAVVLQSVFFFITPQQTAYFDHVNLTSITVFLRHSDKKFVVRSPKFFIHSRNFSLLFTELETVCSDRLPAKVHLNRPRRFPTLSLLMLSYCSNRS